MTLRLAIVGLGKIARDQHLPAIAEMAGVTLAAVVDLIPAQVGLPCFPSLSALFASGPVVDAVAICTPPQHRHEQAVRALAAGKHVLLEKPPGATLAEIAPLVAASQQQGVTLFASWHSRFAAAVEPARAWVATRTLRSVWIEWKEDVRVWHPGQSWIFEPGGLGVFDPGINALSILTSILPNPLFVSAATLDVPGNKDAPIAASLDLTDETGLLIRAEFDFRQTGQQSWTISLQADDGTMVLSKGGACLHVDGKVVPLERAREYPALYRRFVDLCERRENDVDLAPLILVADCFLIGRRRIVSPFED